MQLVIDIPERMYLSAKADQLCGAILLVDAIKNGTPLPTLTDPEQRLFLSAISREEKVCKRIDGDKASDSNARMLVPLCRNIERKVKGVLF